MSICLGAILGQLEPLVGRLGASWGQSGAILGFLDPILGPSWGHPGAILGPSGPSWDHLGPILILCWCILGPSRGYLGLSGATELILRYLGGLCGHSVVILGYVCSKIAKASKNVHFLEVC